MAAVVPSSQQIISMGNKLAILATFSSIANADTWASSMSVVDGVFVTNGASGATLGATYSGGTVTFAASAGLSNVKVLAIGN